MRNTLSKHLTILQQQKVIKGWSDRDITAGEEWENKLWEQLELADIILLLISVDFVSSEYCYSKEMVRALERHNSGEARVIPIIIRPVDWSGTPFAKLQVLPNEGRPVVLWQNKEVAWVDVSKGIKKAAEALAAGIVPEKPSGTKSILPSVSESTEVVSNKEAENKKVSTPHRLIYDAKNKTEIPGQLVRREGDPPSGDIAVDEVYDRLGKVYDFFWNVYERNSIDNKGVPLTATVHYDKNFDNTFWSGKQIVFGDGNSKVFNRFTSEIDIIAREYSHGILQNQTRLMFWEQPGALLNSIADVFASLVKQYVKNQTADEADWLIGAGLLNKKIKGKALRSLANPGTAYNDPEVLGKDPQPAHMRDFSSSKEDMTGGAYYNSGIPNRAFYLVSTAIGGYSWEKAGRIWYEAICDKRLKEKSNFVDFASLTLMIAKRLYGNNSLEMNAVQRGWELVGVNPIKTKNTVAPKVKSSVKSITKAKAPPKAKR